MVTSQCCARNWASCRGASCISSAASNLEPPAAPAVFHGASDEINWPRQTSTNPFLVVTILVVSVLCNLWLGFTTLSLSRPADIGTEYRLFLDGLPHLHPLCSIFIVEHWFQHEKQVFRIYSISTPSNHQRHPRPSHSCGAVTAVVSTSASTSCARARSLSPRCSASVASSRWKALDRSVGTEEATGCSCSWPSRRIGSFNQVLS